MEKDHERLGRLKPEEKVALALDMTDGACASAPKASEPSAPTSAKKNLWLN